MGELIVFEGLDNSGKTTTMRNVYNQLINDGKKVILVAEPGTTDLGLQLRQIIKQSQVPVAPMAEILMFQAAREQLYRDVINPSLADGYTVLSDRSYLSMLAYQGAGLGYLEFCEMLMEHTDHVKKADRVVYLSIPIDLSRARCNELDNIEKRDDEFFARAAGWYNEQAQINDHWIVVDAKQLPEDVTTTVINGLKINLPRRG